jgi:hypothetical protein
MSLKNQHKILRAAAGFLAVALIMMTPVTDVQAEEKGEKLPLNFSGRAVNMSSEGPGGNTIIEIQVSRWSTEAQRQALWNILVEKGQNDLWDALGKEPDAGWFRLATGAARTVPSTPLTYSREIKQGDNWEIILITNRPLSFEEAEAQIKRQTRFNITIIVLQLTKNDKGKWRGSGQLVAGAELNYSAEQNKLEIKNYASEPIRLQEVILR